MCFAHYYRNLRTGSPVSVAKPTEIDRFFAKVNFTEHCWLWTGAISTPYGHGNFKSGERVVKSHRWAWEFMVGPIPDGFVLDHLCRVPNCVRPEHLEPVGQGVNVQRGRFVIRDLAPVPRPIRRQKTDAITRFLGKIEFTDDCWLFDGTMQRHGHMQFKAFGRVWMAHRFAYELFVERVPEGIVLDHLCRTPACVRPDHLELVTRRENTLRGRGVTTNLEKTHCPRGHEYSEENTQRIDGHRYCRSCKREKIAEKRAEKRGPKWERTYSNRNMNKTHCQYGHELAGYNLMLRPNKRNSSGIERRCRTCHNRRSAEGIARAKQRRLDSVNS